MGSWTRTASPITDSPFNVCTQKINFTQTDNGALFTGSVQGSNLTLLYNGGHFIYVLTFFAWPLSLDTLAHIS